MDVYGQLTGCVLTTGTSKNINLSAVLTFSRVRNSCDTCVTAINQQNANSNLRERFAMRS